MKRAILSGFEPFGPYKYNPVSDTAKEYNKKNIGDVEVIGIVLPCTYYGAFDLLSEKIDSLCPDMVIGSGLASRIHRIRVETIGKNIMDGKYADAQGRMPCNEPILVDGRTSYKTPCDPISIVYSIHNCSIPVELSVDAEAFICNSLIYLTSRRITEERLPISFSFFHTPWTDDYLDRIKLEQGKSTISKADLRKTIETIIKSS